MYARVDRARLAEGLALCLGSIDPKSTFPQLACVRLEPSAVALVLSTTDLNCTTIHTVDAEEADGEPICVDAKRLHEIVKGLDARDVTLDAAEGRIAIQTDRATYRIPTLTAEDFPKLFDVPQEMQALVPGDLAVMLGRAAHTMGSDLNRPTMDGVQIDGDGADVNIFSTNAGHAASWIRQPGSLNLSAHIPAKGTNLLRSVLAELEAAEVAKLNGWLIVRGRSTTIGIKLFDEHVFPPVPRFMPKALAAVTVERAALVRATKLMISVGAAAGASTEIMLHLGARTLFLQALAESEGSERLDLQRKLGEPYSVKLNARYLLAALAVHDDEEIRIETGYRRMVKGLTATAPPTLEETSVVFRGAAGASLVGIMAEWRTDKGYHGPTDDELAPQTAPAAAAKKPRAKKAPAAPKEEPCQAAPAPVPSPATAPSTATVPAPASSSSTDARTSSPASAPVTTPIPTQTTTEIPPAGEPQIDESTCGARHPSGPAICGEAADHGGLRRGAGEHHNIEWNGAPAIPAALLRRAEEIGRKDRAAACAPVKHATGVASLLGRAALEIPQDQRAPLLTAYLRGFGEERAA